MVFWMPLMGNIINGLGHALGYRTFGTRDDSHNLYPWGIWILGEELHNNHHADPRSAKFKAHWWEFDIGWFYIRILSFLRLANVLYARTAPPREFAAKFYRDSADRVNRRLDRALSRIQRTREAGLRRIERARQERDLVRLDRAAARARARVDRVRPGKFARVARAKAEARAALDRAREAARARIVPRRTDPTSDQPATARPRAG